MDPDLTFESIAEAGRSIVEAHKRKKGFNEGIRGLLSKLYPDNAHFIYELLQNAEDANATDVIFELSSTSLEVHHNGSRIFSLNDIDSITSIGDSTKEDDPTQIGKFGVGFKAVYSYTTRPEIRSGPYSFAIEDLFVNQVIEGKAPPGQTSFRFPFDRDDKPSNVACREVARGLVELDEKTLLFLNSITTITYTLPDGSVGIVGRQNHDHQTISIQKSEGDKFVESHWLRLVGNASVTHDGPAPLAVAVAFRLDDVDPAKPKTRKAKADSGATDTPTRSVVPLEQGDVSIYFPAVKESSGLKFHIHAPFASTVARDSVSDDPGNVQLVEDIARLIVDSLPSLRDQGFINDSFLAALPNADDSVGYPYSLIRSAVVEAFNHFEITPIRGSGYAPAKSLVASPGEFRNWLAEGDLSFLTAMADIETEQTPRWIRDRDGRAGKFLAGLDTIEFGWDELDRVLTRVEPGHTFGYSDGKYGLVVKPDAQIRSSWMEWLNSKSDGAILDLYQLVGRGCATRSLSPPRKFNEIPLVRLRRKGANEHVKGSDTFLPFSRSDDAQMRVPVDLAYFEDDEDQVRANNLRAFYGATGVRRWNESARIEARLKPYKAEGRPVPVGNAMTKHIDDVKAFVRYARSNPQSALGLFADVAFLLSPHPDGSLDWKSPFDMYIDTPFLTTGLSSLYKREKIQWDDEDEDLYEWTDVARDPIAGLYLEVEDFVPFLELLGSQTRINIDVTSVFHNAEMKREWWVNNRHSNYTEMTDWDIWDLDDIVNTGDHLLIRTLWHTVVEMGAETAEAVYRANASAPRHTFESQLAQRLKNKAWVLDKNGDWKFTREVSLDDLPADWQQPGKNSLAHRLDFGAEVTHRRQKAEGVSAFLRDEGLDDDGIELLREAKEGGVSIEEIRDFIRGQKAMGRFPGSASVDTGRRFAVAALDAASAPNYEIERRQRAVVVDQGQASAESRTYLRGQYTTDKGEMFCQACQKPLPFKVNGEWYFEAVRFVSARRQVLAANVIAVCPLCAALYKHARETKNDTLMEALVNSTISEGQGTVEIPVLLDGKRVPIRFTGKHAIDLQAALGIAGDERA